ncbi:MAG: hypothetical protein U9Q61_05095 [Thermodesulfobacteriota bacterium]|nr:hypothetical protein [Thermodesulfobacteriota bacterium]
MKYDFNFSNMPNYVLIKTGEFAVVEDFYKLLKDLLASPKWIKETPLIIDHQYLDLKKMTFEEVKMIQSIVEFYAEKLGGGKCAFVIQGNSKTLAAELTSRSAKESLSAIKFFSDLDTAKRWILV